MAPYPTRFDALYVVSDLHLGGQRDERGDFQIFNRGARLGGFVRHVTAERPDQDVALVLNGDVIDSLADESVPGYVALDAGTALALMERLYADRSFAPVWEALSDFVRAPRRHLVIVVGNHDVELALPVVAHSLRERLAQGDSAAQARITFATHGAGFACQVGAARVFCTHGNEVDPWNWVDYNALGQLASAMNSDRAVPAAGWTPNAGTRLVVDVMNRIKRRYPFVDLLKPEHAALVGVLTALNRRAFAEIDLSPFVAIGREKARGQDVVSRLLGPGAEPAVDAPPPADEAVHELLGPNLRAALRTARGEDELLLAATLAVADQRAPAESLAAATTPETLGGGARAGALLAGMFGLLPREEGLRRALQDWMKDDTTYDPGAADEWDDALCGRAGAAVDFLVAGHTHLARARRREHGFYFNCGTWIRLLKLTPQVLAGEQVFGERLWPALECGRMSALDEASIPGPDGDVPLLFDRTTAVRVARDADGTAGELLRVGDGASQGAVTLALEPGTSAFRRR
jgi:UDP-2,3-diacylglucosamine pyrophosphatase LpxH